MPETKPNNGVLFPNKKESNERRPDYTGVANVAEQDFKLAAWKRIDRKGNEYLKLSFTETDPTQNRED